jgi:hypothetical protein
MNERNTVPGFTAENSLSNAWVRHRTAGVFDSHTGPQDVQPAYNDACLNMRIAFLKAPSGSFEELVFGTAYVSAGC